MTETGAKAAVDKILGEVDASTSVGPIGPTKPKTYYASVYPGPGNPLPDEFARAVLQLQEHIGVPIWMLVLECPRSSDQSL